MTKSKQVVSVKAEKTTSTPSKNLICFLFIFFLSGKLSAVLVVKWKSIHSSSCEMP